MATNFPLLISLIQQDYRWCQDLALLLIGLVLPALAIVIAPSPPLESSCSLQPLSSTIQFK